MPVKQCQTDVDLELEAKTALSSMETQLGYGEPYAVGDSPIDWAEVMAKAQEITTIAGRAIEHGKSCEQCKHDAENGYEEEEL